MSITVGDSNSCRVNHCIASNVSQDYKEWFKKLQIQRKHTHAKESDILKTTCTLNEQIFSNRENIPTNTQIVSENIDETDNELPTSKINNLFVNVIKGNIEESKEESCKANKVPMTHSKPKDYIKKHSGVRRNLSSFDHSLKDIKGVVRIEAYLEKYSDSLLGSWKERYCILKDHSFTCYENKGSSKIKCCVNFRVTNCVLMLENGKKPTKFQYYSYKHID